MKIAIIGGGMSGMTCAITAKRLHPEYNVALIECKERLGKKIAQTGNGRCNIGNADVDARFYNASRLVDKYIDGSNAQTDEFLDFIGLMRRTDEQGRVYPITDCAASVVDCLREKLRNLGVTESLNTTVSAIRQSGKTVELTTSNGVQIFDEAVLAVGSKILNNLFRLPDCQLSTTKLAPSLVPIKVVNPIKYLNGVRCPVKATLFQGKSKVDAQQGEILFKEYGLSGICIFNLSATIARDSIVNSVKPNGCGNFSVEVDLLPQIELDKLAAILRDRLNSTYTKDTFFYGILHNKLSQAVTEKAIQTNKTDYAYDLAKQAKHLVFEVSGLLDESMAQTVCGGIDELSINDDLSVVGWANKLYAVGELLNVDGICGGYNLHWAILSGIVAGTNL